MDVLFELIAGMTFSGSIAFLLSMLLRKILTGVQTKKWVYHVYLLLATTWVIPYGFLYSGLEKGLKSASLLSGTVTETGQTEMEMEMGSGAGAFVTEKIEQYFIEPIKSVWQAVWNHPVNVSSDPVGEYAVPILNFIVIGCGAMIVFLIIRYCTQYCLECRKLEKYCLKSSSATDCLKECQSERNDSSEVEIFISPKVKIPIVVGLRRTSVILPNITLSEDELKIIVKHELIHIKRKDHWVIFIMGLICCVHWFNPFVYSFKRVLECQCELCCDETLASKMNWEERKQYGFTILKILEQSKDQKEVYPLKSTMGFCKNTGEIETRLEDIVRMEVNHKKWAGALTVLFLAVVLGLSGVSGSVAEALSNASDQPAVSGKDESAALPAKFGLPISGQLQMQYRIAGEYDIFIISQANIEKNRLILRAGDSMTYFQNGGIGWKLKERDVVTIRIKADITGSTAPSRGDMSVGYNVNGRKYDQLAGINMIDSFKIRDMKELSFKVPEDGEYSFTLNGWSSDEFIIDYVDIDVAHVGHK